MLEIISQCSKIRGPSSGIQATGTKYRRFQPFLAVYRMHVTSMLLAHRSKCIPYVRARGSNSCAHAMSMLLDIHSKCMSCAPRRLRGCFWKREVKGLQLYTVTSMCFLDPCWFHFGYFHLLPALPPVPVVLLELPVVVLLSTRAIDSMAITYRYLLLSSTVYGTTTGTVFP